MDFKSTKYLGKSPNLMLSFTDSISHILILNPNKSSMGGHDLNINGCCMLPGVFACHDRGIYYLSAAAD